MLGVMATIASGIELRGLRALDAVTFGLPYIELTDRTFPVSGAGQGGAGVWTVSFNPHWASSQLEPLEEMVVTGGVETRN